VLVGVVHDFAAKLEILFRHSVAEKEWKILVKLVDLVVFVSFCHSKTSCSDCNGLIC